MNHPDASATATAAPPDAQAYATLQSGVRRSVLDAFLCALWVGSYSIILLFFLALRRLEGISTRFKGGQAGGSVE